MLVVPRKTSYTPDHAWIGMPDLFFPECESVEISVVFTADIPEARRIEDALRGRYSVKVGGPAFGDSSGDFTPGRYVKSGVIFTSRGCPKQCPWCYVPKREGKIRTLAIHQGNIVQDNNLLACPREHQERVFSMLRGQKRVNFRGGLDADFLQQWHMDEMCGLSIDEVWLAYDAEDRRKTLTAIEQFRAHGFRKRNVRCYCLAGFQDDTLDKAEGRCREVFNRGGLPFAQVFDGNPDPENKWRKWARTWQRPAATFAHMKNQERPK